jgi:hypothetical protein
MDGKACLILITDVNVHDGVLVCVAINSLTSAGVKLLTREGY